MSKSLLFAALACMGIVTPAAAKSSTERTVSEVRDALYNINRKAAQINADNVAASYKPQTVRFQYYNRYDSTWNETLEQRYTYYPDGSLKTEEVQGQKTTYAYNTDGYVAKAEVTSTVNGQQKIISTEEYTYDPVVKDYVVLASTKFYDGNTTPVYSSTYGTEITRNSDGNITQVRDFFVGANNRKEYSDDYMTIEYGPDRKAVKVSRIEIDEDEDFRPVTVVKEEWTDIVWDRTDGQILDMEYDDPDGEMYFSANRVASAKLTDNSWPRQADFTATYDGDSYHSLVKMDDQRLLEIDFKCIEKFPTRPDFDECYSYEATVYEVEYDEENGKYLIDYTSDRTEKNTADAFGHIIYNETTDVYHYTGKPDETETEIEKTDVVYDETYGYPIQAAKWQKKDNATDFIPESLYFYADYIKIEDTGADTVIADTTDAPAEYYSLQGVRVNNPASGLYIVRQGNRVSKVLMK